jgi:hypothetical protein
MAKKRRMRKTGQFGTPAEVEEAPAAPEVKEVKKTKKKKKSFFSRDEE